MSKIIIGNKGNGSLGDSLWITPLFKKNTGTVQMHTDAQCKRVSVIYNGICDVEFIEPPMERVDKVVAGKYHAAQKMLDFFGIKDVNCIPKIKVTEDEYNKASLIFSKYNNPIAIMADNAGSGRNDNPSALYRKVPIEYLNFLVNELKNKGFTPIQFGLSKTVTNIDGTVKHLDLPIRELAAAYKYIGKYVGGDTGDYHLSLSVGANAFVLIPDHNPSAGYDYDELLYFNHLWKDEKVRVNYFNFKNYKDVISVV